LKKHMAEKRRAAIAFEFIQTLGAPPKTDWIKLDIVNKIMRRFEIPKGSRTKVTKTLDDVLKVHEQQNVYNPKRQAIRHGKIEDLTPQADVVYNAFSTGNHGRRQQRT
jgi:hypothetical protein